MILVRGRCAGFPAFGGHWSRLIDTSERTTPTSQQWPWAFFVGGGGGYGWTGVEPCE